MAIDSFIAGAYSALYNAVGVGITAEGFKLDIMLKEEQINETDAYGGSLLDYVYRGGDATMEFKSKAFKAGSVAPMWPWGPLGQIVSLLLPVGRLASDAAQTFLMTAAANTPAAMSAYACTTLTASKAILAPGYNASLLFNSKLREVPCKLALLPYSPATGTLIHFTLA